LKNASEHNRKGLRIPVSFAQFQWIPSTYELTEQPGVDAMQHMGMHPPGRSADLCRTALESHAAVESAPLG
jgi:hypothetical protein